MTKTSIGEIYVCRIPYENKKGQKPRIVVTVSETDSIGNILVISESSRRFKKSEELIMKATTDDIKNGKLENDITFYVPETFVVTPKLLIKKIGNLNEEKLKELLKKRLLSEAEKYYNLIHKPAQNKKFIERKSRIKYSGRFFNGKEIINLIDSALDFWLTSGPYARKLEQKMCDYFKAKNFYLINSGSSANLIVVSSLRSPQFEEQLKPGDEIITPAVTFPTTLTPIIQNQLVPVFVDCEIGTYNIDPNQIEAAVSPRTRALFIPHTLGNPCNMDVIMDIAERKRLIVLEDVCDALGATFNGKKVGTFGSMSSLSFYPAHHITMGEGGGIIINDERFTRIALSMRDWGRDCWCEPGFNNTCGKRFSGQFGNLPFGYDHKYVYSNMGYNLKITDMQAAIGLAQLDKLNKFIKKRRNNFDYYYKHLKSFEDWLILPKWERQSNPSWFGFPVTVKKEVDINSLIGHLEKAKIETRKVFAGNVLKQPGFKDIKYRIYGELKHSDIIMENTFFIGVYPGLTAEMREFVVKEFEVFFNR